MDAPGTSVTPAEAAGRRPALPSLTGMRFLAAAAVFFSHSFFQFVPSSWGSDTGTGFFWSKAGSAGVSFFFVLSGFVLTWSARADEPARAFWRRRACKIYPNHLVTAAAAVLLIVSHGGTVSARQLLPNLALLHTWLPVGSVLTGVNTVSWSLCCEAFFYLSFPLLSRALRAVPERRLWWCAGGLVALVWCVPLVARLLLPGDPVLSPRMPYSEVQLWFVYFFPVTRCLEFLLGMVLARLVADGRFPRVPLVPAGALVAGAYVAALYAPGQYGTVAVCVAPLGLLIASGAVADAGGRPSVLRRPAMVWLGEVSFALYMVHQLLIDEVARRLGINAAHSLNSWSAAALSLPVLGGALTLAWLLYRGVELPVMRKWSRRHRPLLLEVGELS
ncbi:acyltransferase [Streptomyces sp. UNOC14_S4]|uniref:acyltransferase family protein n=1 Tax=Streptomyces sp. UNOC14_S4 TaxID=2872340 RepID=UPI001E3578E6|nr:acyltransferase [Streptomyces sp. UNOC14_S4]MCC3767132.1 acyltransferase [Streptomyces sp. UNOC14_S4]